MPTTGSTLPSRDTGLPINLQSLASSIPISQSQITGTAPRSDVGTSTSTERTSQAVSQATSSVNTTPGALAALEGLLTQLSTRPNISDAELAVQFPQAVRVFNPNTGWSFTNPLSGFTMSTQEAQEFNAKQASKIEVARKAAGTTPGGSEQQKIQQGERATEIKRNRETQGKYSKEAATMDANALIQKSITDALEAAMPQITAGLEGAGTSRSTIAAGLTQKAALKGATEGAALGANLGTAYGQINTQLSGVLEMLTRADPNSPEALLLQTIIGSKGLVTSGSSSQVQTGESTKTTDTTAKTGGQLVDQETIRAPMSPLTGGPGNPMSGLLGEATNPYYAFQTSLGQFANTSSGMLQEATSADALYGTSPNEVY